MSQAPCKNTADPPGYHLPGAWDLRLGTGIPVWAFEVMTMSLTMATVLNVASIDFVGSLSYAYFHHSDVELALSVMHIITPRTCLWPLTGTLICTFVLSIGLTFRSNHACYAGVCGEWLFPLQARIHVVVWYCWLAISVTILALRAFQHNIAQVLRRPMWRKKIPLLGKQLHTGGALMVLWIIGLYAIVTGVWWHRLESYFDSRGRAQGDTRGNSLLAAIALTGHYADITMGMALLPVSRHSALASFFKLSVSTTLTFHMLTAYTLFALTLIHGLLYIGWLTTRHTVSLSVLQSFPILEPTYEANEVYPGNTSSLGIWRASLIFTGCASALIMLIILFTTLPRIRKNHFNLFYFTHLTSILAVIIICLHASTMFYCTAPGLSMIVLDWSMRVYELRQSFDAKVAHLGKGWYVLSVDLPRARLSGCSCKSPLAHFYIRHGTSSVRELHPFTTITHLSSQNRAITAQDTSLPMQFLFRKSRRAVKPDRHHLPTTSHEPNETKHPLRLCSHAMSCLSFRKRKAYPKLQWTERLASITEYVSELDPKTSCDNQSCSSAISNSTDTKVRFEGPYFTPALPQQYDAVICIVAGTGVSGALAIAAAFAAYHDENDDTRAAEDMSQADTLNIDASNKNALPLSASATLTQNGWQRLSIWWSVRAEDYINLPFDALRERSGLDVRSYLTGPGHSRMDIAAEIRAFKSSLPKPHNRVWAYISGPNGFISAAEVACKQAGLDHYGARWDI